MAFTTSWVSAADLPPSEVPDLGDQWERLEPLPLIAREVGRAERPGQTLQATAPAAPTDRP